MSWDREELIGLIILLLIVIGLTLAGKLTAPAVDALKWIGGSFFAMKGVGKISIGGGGGGTKS